MRILTALLLSALIGQAQAPHGAIEGRVVLFTTHEPIANVQVTLVASLSSNAAANLPPDVAGRLAGMTEALTRAGLSEAAIETELGAVQRAAVGAGASQVTAVTDASGHFVFRDLAPGRYTMRALREGYFAPGANGVFLNVASTTVEVKEGQVPSNAELQLVKGGVVSGRVRDANGQAPSVFNVIAYRVAYNNGRKTWNVAASKTTDDRGEYRIYWLPPGEYYVGNLPSPVGPDPVPTLFQGATSPAAATPVVVHEGAEVTGVDLDLRANRPATFKISGTAINPSAKANPFTSAVDRSIATFFLVTKEPWLLDGSNAIAMVNAIPIASRPNGEFEIRNVPPGAYDIYPAGAAESLPSATGTPTPPAVGAPLPFTIVNVAPGVPGTPAPVVYGTATLSGRRQPTSRTTVNVNGDVTGLRITTNPGVDLAGQVIINGNAKDIKLDSLRVSLRVLDTTPPVFTNSIGPTPVDASGAFLAPRLPEARYAVQVSGLTADAYVGDVRQGGTSVADNGFVVDPTSAPIQILVGTDGSIVGGSVQNAEKKPAANTTVVLVPATAHRKNALLYRTTTTNDSGRFTVRGVAPGQYKVFAFESILNTAWLNAEYLAKYEERGSAIMLPGSSGDLLLNLIPAK